MGGNSSGAPIDQTNGNFLGGRDDPRGTPPMISDTLAEEAGLKNSEIVQIGASRSGANVVCVGGRCQKEEECVEKEDFQLGGKTGREFPPLGNLLRLRLWTPWSNKF